MSLDPIGLGDLIRVLIDEINSSCSYNISSVALVDDILSVACIKH
jgi:hypothetical protein